jgi:hypothetical protein
MEAKLRSKIEETTDLEAKKELKAKLSDVLKKEEQLAAMIEGNGGTIEHAADNPEKVLQMLMEKEAKLKQMLAKETDAAKKVELKKNLENVLAKQEELKAQNGGNGGGPAAGIDIEIQKLKQEYMMLKQKEEDVRTQLASTKDAEQKTKLEQTLQKVLQKQADVKAKVESLKTAK